MRNVGLGYGARNALTGKQRETGFCSIPGMEAPTEAPVKVPMVHGDPLRNDSCCNVNDMENQTVTNAFDSKTFEADKQRKFDVKMRDNSCPESGIPI